MGFSSGTARLSARLSAGLRQGWEAPPGTLAEPRQPGHCAAGLSSKLSPWTSVTGTPVSCAAAGQWASGTVPDCRNRVPQAPLHPYSTASSTPHKQSRAGPASPAAPAAHSRTNCTAGPQADGHVAPGAQSGSKWAEPLTQGQ